MRPIFRCMIRDTTVLWVIVINAAALFLDAFPAVRDGTGRIFWWIDYGCVIYFLLEVILKLSFHGKRYWRNGWNRFDFMVVVASLPTLAAPFTGMEIFSIVLIFRLARLFRFVRVFRFIPHGPRIWAGVQRALKASVGILVVLLILNLVFALGATFLFGEEAPEHFGDPLISSYTLFKVFTVEGWHEIPDQMARDSDSNSLAVLARLYFIIAVFVGGILGLSLVNAIFVDEMTADNTDRLEFMVLALRQELEQFQEENRRARDEAFARFRQDLDGIKEKMEVLDGREPGPKD